MSENEQTIDALIDLIEDDEDDNPRTFFEEREIKALALTIQAIGMLVPVILMPGKVKTYRVVDGLRRLKAKKLLQAKTIRAVVRETALDAGERLHHQLVINCRRVDFRPLEKARGIDELMKTTGWNAVETAKQLGMSPAGITRSMTLLTAAQPIQQLIEEGRLAESTAYQILLEKDSEKQLELANAAANGASRDVIAAAVKRTPISAMSGEKSPMSRAKVELGGGASVTVAASDLTFERYIAHLKAALGKASKAHSKALSLREHIKAQRDEAKGTTK